MQEGEGCREEWGCREGRGVGRGGCKVGRGVGRGGSREEWV